MANIIKVDDRDCVKFETRIIAHRGKEGRGNWFEHQYLNKNLKWRKLLYGKTVTQVPTTNCIITVPTDKLHSEDVLRAKYPAMWVDEIVSTEAILGDANPIQFEAVSQKRNPLDDL